MFFLTLKTPNGIFSLGILLYTFILTIIYAGLKQKHKAFALVLCFVPAIFSLVHLGIYGFGTFSYYTYLYAESLIPLVLIIPAKKKILSVFRIVSANAITLILCVLFLVNFIGNAKIHNYSRYSYTESFTKFLDTIVHNNVENKKDVAWGQDVSTTHLEEKYYFYIMC